MTWEEYEEQRWLQSQTEEDAFWAGKTIADAEAYTHEPEEYKSRGSYCGWCGFPNRSEPGFLCRCCIEGCEIYSETIRCPIEGEFAELMLSYLKGGDLPDVRPKPKGLRSDRSIFEQLKEVDLAAYAERYTRLRQTRADTWVGLCPIHSEKTPSFYIWSSPWRWRCFGCGRHGDIVDLEEEIHGKG